jgi:aspartate 1-decarboxylase
MQITFCTGKLHRARVTDACLDYQGSITIDRKLMKAAGIVPFQLLHINNIANAAHWETYVIPGKSGEICLNGAPARLFQPGDKVIILALANGTLEEAARVQHKAVFVDDDNKILRVELKSATGLKIAYAANDARKNGRSPATVTR